MWLLISALVVAEDFGIARHAASLVRVEYDAAAHTTDLDYERRAAYVPPKKRKSTCKPVTPTVRVPLWNKPWPPTPATTMRVLTW